jgi:PAS domain S-box-containing protein
LVTLALGFSDDEFEALCGELESHVCELELRRPVDPGDLIAALGAPGLDAVLIREHTAARKLNPTIRYIRSAAPSLGITIVALPSTETDRLLEAGAHEVLPLDASFNDIRIAVRRSSARAFATVKNTPTSSISVFDRLPVPTFRTLIGGEIMQANNPMGHLLGYPSGNDMIGLDIRRFYVDLAVRDDILDRITASDDMIRTETQFVRNDGRTVWVAIMNYLVRDAFERPLYIEGIVLDITELRRERRRTAAAELGYKRLFDDSPVALWELDCSTTADRLFHEVVTVGHGQAVARLHDDMNFIAELVDTIQIRQVNQAALRMCRPSPTSEFEREWLDHSLMANNGALARSHFLAVLAGQRELDQIQTVPTDSGEIHARVYWGATRSEGDRPYQRVIVAITDETTETEHRSQLQQSIESKERFIASVSHHLRTPMTAILGFAQEIVDGSSQFDEVELKAILSEIVSASKAAAAIVEDMAVASLAEDEPLSVSLGPVDAAAAVRRVIDDMPIDKTCVTLALTEATCLADAGRLRQVIRGMVTNAIEHGGSHVDISVTERNDLVHIAVIDDGPGIESGEAARVFQPHFAGHMRTTSPAPIGLGLHVARALAQAMRGDLTYERPNGHTIFRLVIPAYAVNASGEADPEHR